MNEVKQRGDIQMTNDTKTKKTAKKTSTAKAPAEQKDLDLNKGQYLLFDNDKGDNPKRPDLTGQVHLLDGTIANISGFKKWTATNQMKLELVIQIVDNGDYNTIGRANLFGTGAKDPSKNIMSGEAEFENAPAMLVTLKRRVSKDGKQYFSGYFNEIALNRVDPLADTTEADKAQAHLDELSM